MCGKSPCSLENEMTFKETETWCSDGKLMTCLGMHRIILKKEISFSLPYSLALSVVRNLEVK